MVALLHWLLLCTVLSSADGFFVDTNQPIIFQNVDRSFGYKTVQFGQSRVIVSAPLQQDGVNKTGTLYNCDPATSRCRRIFIYGSPEDINISLGLTMVAQEGNPSQLLACGPTLQKTCGNSIYVLGRCYQLDNNMRQLQTLPASLPECTIRSLDIAFLIDGSGSIKPEDFKKMLTFVSKVIEDFKGTDTQFAIMQYDDHFKTHFDFNKYSATSDHNSLIREITQLGGTTWTATAIQKVLRQIFISSRGSRKGSQKFLIVITDGEKFGDQLDYQGPIAEAERMGVVRFAIGVGNAFNGAAYRELITIASQPSDKYVYKVSDFSALSNFRKDLQDKIFAIEGVQVQTGSGFQKEMSQDGFSSVLSSDLIMLGAVGAYDWSGGASVYSKGQSFWINETQDQKDMKTAYLGYATHQLSQNLIAIGAPRYQHTGSVLIYQKEPYSSDWNQIAVIKGEKIGSYFGSVLNGGFVNSQLLLLVGAPTFYTPESPGGRVFLCPLNTKASVLQVSCPITLQGDPTQYFGHFGSALCLLPDLTGDKLIDLVVGAPYEDQNQGAIYIFPGKKGGFRRAYIQRIASSQVAKGLMFFGRSMSGNLDMTGDALPDLAIGGAGKVLVLRSRTVVGVSVSMSFDPSEILIASYECPDADTTKAVTTIKVCVACKRKTTAGEVSAQMTYTLQLDASRTQKRAVFAGTEHSLQQTFSLKEGRNCMAYPITLHECVEDSLSPLRVSLNFTLTGQSVLSEDSPTSLSEQVSFQKNCGSDGQCQDDLRINASFGDLRHLVVGVSLEVNVTLLVQNHGEDSYNSRAIITHPPGLSYRKVSLIQSNRRLMTIKCSTAEGERYVICSINNPLLRPIAMAIFVVSFHVSSLADLGNLLTITANVTSDNGGAPNDLMKSTARLKVLYGIYVTVTSLEESTKYTNYSTSERSPIVREVKHMYKVGNQGQRSLPLSIIFMVPVKLKETVVWKEPSIIVTEEDLSNSTTKCINTGEITNAKESQDLTEFQPVLNCTVMTCLRFVCRTTSLDIQKSIHFSITGQVTKDWASQSANQKVLLQSSAEIMYDSDIYQHILEENQPFTRAQAQTVLEVYTEYNYLPMIIGSSVGGLVLLALITAGLYKLGFFKRQYKEMMESPEGQTSGGEDTAMEAQSEQKQTQ